MFIASYSYENGEEYSQEDKEEDKDVGEYIYSLPGMEEDENNDEENDDQEQYDQDEDDDLTYEQIVKREYSDQREAFPKPQKRDYPDTKPQYLIGAGYQAHKGTIASCKTKESMNE